MMEVYNAWNPQTEEKKAEGITNYTCLIFKMMQNKANINDGVKYRRVDWENTENKMWVFKLYWFIKNPKYWENRKSWAYKQVYKYLDNDVQAKEREKI